MASTSRFGNYNFVTLDRVLQVEALPSAGITDARDCWSNVAVTIHDGEISALTESFA
jgi:hypothetical protein